MLEKVEETIDSKKQKTFSLFKRQKKRIVKIKSSKKEEKKQNYRDQKLQK